MVLKLKTISQKKTLKINCTLFVLAYLGKGQKRIARSAWVLWVDGLGADSPVAPRHAAKRVLKLENLNAKSSEEYSQSFAKPD